MAYVYPNRGNTAHKPQFLQRGTFIGLILVAALAAFELFNFATTEYALATLIGGIDVLGVSWSAVLAVAFCAIDFAGLARLFTPEQGQDEPKEVFYLTGAWFLGASMNAIMTWWAVTNALVNRPLGNEVINRQQLLAVVPVFVACLVWLTRILIIGTFGVAGERLFSLGASAPVGKQLPAGRRTNSRSSSAQRPPLRYTSRPQAPRNQPRRATGHAASTGDDEELTYEDVGADGSGAYRPGPQQRGYTRPAPKPQARPRYGYSTRAFSLTQPYIVGPRTPGAQKGGHDTESDNTPFYR